MGFGARNQASYLCSHIFENTHPILLVVRADGDWQFLCGQEHDEDEIPKVIGIGHILDIDPTILELEDLEADWEAERDAVGAPWKKSKIPS